MRIKNVLWSVSGSVHPRPYSKASEQSSDKKAAHALQKYSYAFALPAILMACPALAKDTEPTTIILHGDYVVKGMAKELPIALIVDGATPDRPVLNPEFVKRSQIKKSLIGGTFGIGPIRIDAKTKVVKFQSGDLEWKRRSLWAEQAYTQAYDGGVGPGGIPFDIVTFKLRWPLRGEKTYTFPMTQNRHSVYEMELGNKTIEVLFSQKRDPTLATAAAGAVIAENHDGVFTGEKSKTEIAFGVERPIRELSLSKPLHIIGLSFDRFFVRTSDGGDASSIVDSETLDSASDGNEIVVVGKGKKDKNRYAITLGRDDLAHCSSITYDKIAKQIELSCKPPEPTDD